MSTLTGLKFGIASPNFMPSFRMGLPNLDLVNDRSVVHYDVVIFPGGEDISPSLYNEADYGCQFPNKYRDMTEKKIFDVAYERKIPCVGICRGHQLINALLGGSLYQDLDMFHLGHHGNHEIEYSGSSDFLMRVFPFMVNSYHHQGYDLNRMSKFLEPIAVHPETGIVEIARAKTIATTQFHPEFVDSATLTKFFEEVCHYFFG